MSALLISWPLDMSHTFGIAGVGRDEIDVAGISDHFTINVVVELENAGFCVPGEGGSFVQDRATRLGGRLPVNTDGGCIANGEPIGASGLRQVYEVVTQLRGRAGERQVPGSPRVGFTHVYGAPGISACTVITR